MGHPVESPTTENTHTHAKKTTLLNDRKVKVRKIADILKISIECQRNILYEHLHMTKLFARWVSHFLTKYQKQQRVNDSERNLAIFQRNRNENLLRLLKVDEA